MGKRSHSTTTFPHARISVDETGTNWELSLSGAKRKGTSPSLKDSRQESTQLLGRYAAYLERPLVAEVSDSDGVFRICVHPDGRIEDKSRIASKRRFFTKRRAA
ncbi:MAG: hypothetical protein IKZ87_04315 [Actinomycetaceae bacterium]|nr:hypothetical protein [Actinomycetaceae bacterium]